MGSIMPPFPVLDGRTYYVLIGFVALLVGIEGPLVLDGRTYYMLMATTEWCLVASTNRGCKVIGEPGGAQSVVLRDGMTRALAVRFVLCVQGHRGVTCHVLLFN
ncbi:3-hydroxy-3-methylglutaryl-coenzyme A reductase-like isoform X2 [Asparagus officinalis]|uniref:3-hydroxy-3-methylglutaryl-coenzyme A reductase-like isoform X2 n=1 Tax=Asparagus officinalis TaxID=4686 RepID=UPI00098E6284|nr:3-hydroxy-3-methylglutaryl-coenzyme A reductase-like isoform X2 [Asparagus officinalis]